MQNTAMFRSRRVSSFKGVAFAAVLAVCAASPRANADDRAIEALYPMPAAKAPAITFAGIAAQRLAFSNLRVRGRNDRAPDQGGTTISLADDQSQVAVVVRFVVARDAKEARAFAWEVLRGISQPLSPSTIDEVAFADEGGKGDHVVVAARGNIAYSVSTLRGSFSAAAVAEQVKGAIVAGAPSFPRVRVKLASTIDKQGTAVAIDVPQGTTYRLRATGAYIARSKEKVEVRPFGPGRVEVTAIATDAFGRVTETTAVATAQ